MAKDIEPNTSLEQEELRGVSRTVAEIEWLLLILVLLYYVFGVTEGYDRAAIAVALFTYAGFVMGFRYSNIFKAESRWKIALETWVMTAFITWALWHTGKLESPLVNCYLLVIITCALTLGKATTLLELALVAACFVFLGDHSSVYELASLRYAGGLFAQFAPFVLVAYITTLFSSDIRYGLNRAKLMSETDDLTQALNRRGFAIVSDRLFGQAVRYARPLSVLSIDCDNLKEINDNFGHEGGDRLLRLIVNAAHGQLRSSDVLARYGGDEFVVLLPETPALGAADVAERIRDAVASTLLTFNGRTVATTVSIGCASYPADGRTLDALLARADQAMYQEKIVHRSRNGDSSA
ncbi:MAG: GGDEF domain-containing protein [Rhodocyclaceae bacterium]|nr:GGDEF domain-containing protein [Rhodocyclaceae bacterium]